MTITCARVSSGSVAGIATACLLLLLQCIVAEASGDTPEATAFMAQTRNLPTIQEALAREKPVLPPPASVTGVTVPHHMLAADLIARGIWAASGGHYARVLILSPDHFRVLPTPFGVTTAAFDEVTGHSDGDPQLAGALLAEPNLFSDTGAAPNEHGIHSVAPFVHAVFPNAPIVAITASSDSQPADWDRALNLLRTLIGPETLIVQSTDFSHFLPVDIAVRRDQETLSAIASGDPSAIDGLRQPSHMDSRASQYLQMALQRDLFAATPVIIANRNSAEYEPTAAGTTSYVVVAYMSKPEDGARLRYDDQSVTYFGGDTLLGRNLTELLLDPKIATSVVGEVTQRTGGGRLVINLEGSLLEERPAGTAFVQQYMTAGLALPLLKRLNVVGASLANNHSGDFGPLGLDETRRLLSDAGVSPLSHGEVTDFGTFRVLPLSFKRGYFLDNAVIRRLPQLDDVCGLNAKPPLIVFPHWGEEYSSMPGAFEMEAARALAACGVSAIIGAHSHRASASVDQIATGALQYVFSLGNMIYDQHADRGSGALVEVRVFQQGTIALRMIPLPDLFDEAIAIRRAERP